MSSEGRPKAGAGAPPRGVLHRLRADFLSRGPAAAPAAPRASTLSFFSLDDDEPRGEVTLYPMDIDSNPPSGNTTPEIPRSAQVGQLPEKPSEEVKTLAEAEIEASVLRLSVDYEDDDVPKKPTGKPQKRMLPAAPVAAEAVVRCVCWVLAQRLVRRRLEKAVGASQRWLFANVCSRRTRLALIGVASMLWGTLVSTVSICALFVIIAGNLEPVVDEAAQLGEWSVAVATTAAATFLALHVAHVLFGAFLIAASKVTGYRAPEGNTKLMEKLLLAVFKLMKIELTAPPPTACQHDPRSPSSPPSNSFSPHGFVSSDDEIGKDDRDRSPRPSGSKQEPCRPSHAEAPPTLPTHFSHGHIGWVRPGEGGNGNEGRKWPELPGNWRAPDFSTTVSNLPYPTPCNSNASSTSLTEPGHPPYPVPNHLPYPESNFHPNIPRDLPYPGPSVVPYSVPPSSSGVGQSMGFQTPPGGFNQTSSVEVANYSLKVRILKCQTRSTLLESVTSTLFKTSSLEICGAEDPRWTGQPRGGGGGGGRGGVGGAVARAAPAPAVAVRGVGDPRCLRSHRHRARCRRARRGGGVRGRPPAARCCMCGGRFCRTAWCPRVLWLQGSSLIFQRQKGQK